MLKGKKYLKIGIGIVMLCLLFALGGCTKYASDDDLQALENQKQAALDAEKKVADLEQQKRDLQAELARKEREQRDAQRILDEIKR